MARKNLLVVLVLLTGACTAQPPAPAPTTRTPWKPPSLLNQEGPAQGVLQFVRDVIDARTVELADGSKVRVAQLAPPATCWEASALDFARTTLLASTVRITTFLSGEVNLVLEDGTDYALLAVQRGILRSQGVDGGPLMAAESEAAAANVGLWGPPCEGLDLAQPSPQTPQLPPHQPGQPPTQNQPAPNPPGGTTSPPKPAPTTTQPRPAPTTTTVPRPPARVCAVAYQVTNEWPGGFQVNMTVRNIGSSTINGWTVRWTFPNGQSIREMWNATPRQYGATVDASNASYNGQITPGGTVTIGFNGNMSWGNGEPGAFTLNGQSCTVD